MTAVSTDGSHHQRLHWLAEHVLDWSTLPVVHIHPTVFADNPFFTSLIARSVAEHGTIRLPFGTGRTAPVSAADVARVVATVLEDPDPHIGHVYDLTGPGLRTCTASLRSTPAPSANRFGMSTSRPANGLGRSCPVPGSRRT
jgi:uncharacterized protein YbjT (DUF2867 family)